MAITRWDPFREVVALQNRMNSLFRDLNEGESPLTTASFVPAVDVYEDEKKVVLKLEVPGIEEKDLDVSVENHTLTVKGERKFEKEEKEENFHRIERRYGSFYRAFTLPSTVDTESRGGQLQRRRAEAGAQEEARSPAEADQGQRGPDAGGVRTTSSCGPSVGRDEPDCGALSLNKRWTGGDHLLPSAFFSQVCESRFKIF